jgi:hypothetical protein
MLLTASSEATGRRAAVVAGAQIRPRWDSLGG